MAVDERMKATLQGAGVWPAFHRRRTELIAQGFSPEQAQKMAFEEVMVPAEPVVAGAAVQEAGGVLELGPPRMEPEFKFEESVDMRKAANWVLQALALPVVRFEQAPTLAAWSMYQWAKLNKDEFFRGFGVKQMPSKVEDAGEAKRDDGRKQIDLAERLMRKRAERNDPILKG